MMKACLLWLSVITLCYPLQSLHENISPEPQIKLLEHVSHESSPDPMTGTPKDESGQETFETPREINQTDQSLEPENLNNLEKLEDQEQIKEDTNEDETLLQPDPPEGLNSSEEPQLQQINHNTDPNKKVVVQLKRLEDRPAEEPHVIKSRSIQVFDDKIPVGSVSWKEKEAKAFVDSEDEVTNLETDENLERSIRSDDPTFDSACSIYSCDRGYPAEEC
ncbi:uncharacterized protein ankmy1 [Carassius gibelio]|uniref:uncharacterized protein ankmy1 n=1 Tax=Carassius gibelio TaxID=101364 RepID=UPI002277828D|nr:uncharacterized protein ankmy1 [Carassius gibelio]